MYIIYEEGDAFYDLLSILWIFNDTLSVYSLRKSQQGAHTLSNVQILYGHMYMYQYGNVVFKWCHGLNDLHLLVFLSADLPDSPEESEEESIEAAVNEAIA